MSLRKARDYSLLGGAFAAVTLALAALQYAFISGALA